MPVEITDAHVQEAIAVRRGQKRIADLPRDLRGPVEHVLRHTSDARLAVTAGALHAPRGRSWQYAKPRFGSLRRE